jgi:hypothetical protein
MYEADQHRESGSMNEEQSNIVSSIRSDDRSVKPPIAKGARFRMSVLGAARNPRLAEKEGTIVGGSRLNSSVRVLFDGRKSPMSLHRDYIKLIASGTE